MLLNAYAGTGKTSTLELYARAFPQLRFLYLCFNRDNAREAQQRFPGYCECATIHSKAWHAVGRQFERVANPRPREVMEVFKLATSFLAVYVLDTLNAFLHSADPEIDWKHVRTSPETPERQRIRVRSVARKLWDRMQDPEDGTIPMSHDGYLKLWALQKPTIDTYDIIFLDEAQDTNPVTLEIVLEQVAQKRAGLVLVGDTHQSIYSWRDAVDAMEQAAGMASFHFPLTESFRFGDGIAHDATILLNELKGDNVKLIGRGNSTGKSSSFAVLGRTNATLIAAAVEKALDGIPIHFSATTAQDNWDPFVPYKFQMTLDVYHLWSSQRHLVRDPYIKKFASFDEVEEHARGEGTGGHGRDVELALQIELVKEQGDDIPGLLELLRKQSCGPGQAKLAFSTVHRAKGKEWDAVRLLDDFLDPNDEDFLKNGDPAVVAEESNILYVAVTRARKKLMYPEELYEWFASLTKPTVETSHRMEPRPSGRGEGEPTDSHSTSTNPKPAGTLSLKSIARRIAVRPLKKPTSNLLPKLQKTRETYARAYEPWDYAEDKLLSQAFLRTQSIEALSKLFRRPPKAINKRITTLNLKVG